VVVLVLMAQHMAVGLESVGGTGLGGVDAAA
jgi:hypothetical protein